MAVRETPGRSRHGREKGSEVGEEFLYFIKGATLRASRSARRQRPHHQAADGSALNRGRRVSRRAF
jgi:hypothetical protein